MSEATALLQKILHATGIKLLGQDLTLTVQENNLILYALQKLEEPTETIIQDEEIKQQRLDEQEQKFITAYFSPPSNAM